MIYPVTQNILQSLEAKVLTDMWREHYNKIRPHSSLNFALQVPEVILPLKKANA